MSTGRVTASQFTAIWLVLGTGLNMVLMGVPAYRMTLKALGVSAFTPSQPSNIFFTRDLSEKYLPFDAVFAATILSFVGLGLLFLSSRLDFVDPKDDPLKNGIVPVILGILVLLFGVSWICLLGIELERWGLATGSDLLGILSAIPMLLLSLPALFVSNFYVLLCTSLFMAGLVTIPRTMHAFSRRHRLSQAWTRGMRSQQIDPAAVIGAFGDRTASGAEGRKLRKDADRLRDEVEAHVIKLRAVRDKLRAEVLSNDQAAGIQREADDILARLAALTARTSHSRSE